MSKLKRYEDETGKLYTFSDSVNPDGSSCGLEEKSGLEKKFLCRFCTTMT